MHSERQGAPDGSAGRRRALIGAALAIAACRSSPRSDGPPPSAPDAAPAPPASPPPPVPAAPTTRAIGPYELSFAGRRKVYYAAPRSLEVPARVVANLHGVCNPPGYACGHWLESASRVGFLVCPEGNATCGPSGPPTWTEPTSKIDEDLEAAIEAVSAAHPGEVGREGAVLTGFSLGAYAAARIATTHPGRWPYLVLTEANVPLEAAALRKAGVKAVALVAGERGTQIAGERRTVKKLSTAGFPARLWVMKGAGHHYSADVDTLMGEALAWVLSHE